MSDDPTVETTGGDETEESCFVLSCGCGQGVYSELVANTVEVRDYLATESNIEIAIENFTGSGFQIIDGEFLELN